MSEPASKTTPRQVPPSAPARITDPVTAPGPTSSRRTPALIAVYAVVLAGFVALPLVADDYWLNILVLGFISSIVVFSLNVLTGYAGLLSFGQAGFVGVGAYAYGVLTVAGVHPLLALLAGVLLALVMGLALGLPAARLKGHYLAIGTLGFGVLIAQALNNMVDVTRGPMGLLGIRSFGWSHHAWYWAGLAISLSIAALLHWIERRTFLGVILKSVKYDEISATASGIAVFAVKLGAFCVSAALAGFAGALFASYVRFLTPDLFNSAESFRYLMMAVVGGAVSASGGWIAALVLTALPEALRGLGESNLRLLVYGATVLCVLWFLPQGVGGVLETWSTRLRRPRRTTGAQRDHGHGGGNGNSRGADGDGDGHDSGNGYGNGKGKAIGSASASDQAGSRDRADDTGAVS